MTELDSAPAEQPSRLDRIRAERPRIDHVLRAVTLYGERNADVLAGAVTFFGFLALFPVLLLAVSVAGFVLAGRPDLLNDLIGQIGQVIPGDAGQPLIDGLRAAIENRGAVGVVGLLGFLYAGIGFMSKLRIAIQTLWNGQPETPNFLRDNARDLATLLGLGLGLVVSLALTAGGTAAATLLLDLVGLGEVTWLRALTALAGVVLAIIGSTVVFAWLFSNASRTGVSFKLVLPGAILAAVGFEILKLVGGFYLGLVSGNVSAGVFGSVVGILLWIFILTRFILFSVAWTATLNRFVKRGLGPGGADDAVVAGARQRYLSGDDPDAPGPAAPPASPAAVAAGLLAAGAVVGTVAAPAIRRWWNGKPVLGAHPSKREPG